MQIPLPASSCLIVDAAGLTLAKLVSIWVHSALVHIVLAQFCQICGNLWGCALGHSLNRLFEAHLCSKWRDGWASPCVVAENWAVASSCHNSQLKDPTNLVQLIRGLQDWQQLCMSTCWRYHPWCDLLMPWYVTVPSALPSHCSSGTSFREWHLCCCHEVFSQDFSKARVKVHLMVHAISFCLCLWDTSK